MILLRASLPGMRGFPAEVLIAAWHRRTFAAVLAAAIKRKEESGK